MCCVFPPILKAGLLARSKVRDTLGGGVFGVRDCGWADVDGVVLSASLEEEAFGDYVGDGEG